jgi:hypothetical protein
MMGVGFIVLFMTPFFIAVHAGNEDADDEPNLKRN